MKSVWQKTWNIVINSFNFVYRWWKILIFIIMIATPFSMIIGLLKAFEVLIELWKIAIHDLGSEFKQ